MREGNVFGVDALTVVVPSRSRARDHAVRLPCAHQQSWAGEVTVAGLSPFAEQKHVAMEHAENGVKLGFIELFDAAFPVLQAGDQPAGKFQAAGAACTGVQPFISELDDELFKFKPPSALIWRISIMQCRPDFENFRRQALHRHLRLNKMYELVYAEAEPVCAP